MPEKKQKSKKLESLSEIDGMAQQEKYAPTTLDQVFGDDGTGKYKTLDTGTYEKVLDNMSKSDLKSEAVRVGLLPIDNMPQLRARLAREFQSHVNSYKRPTSNTPTPNNNQPSDISDEVRRILSEGK
jgi:hypothetical protein